LTFGPRFDLLELRTHLVEERRFDDTGCPRRGVAVLLEDVPGGEHEIVQPRELDDFADLRRAAFRALSETNGPHLGQRSDGFGESFPNSEHAGDRRRAHGTEADEQDPESAGRRGDVNGRRHERQTISRVR
jgi:hypothetical protein